MASGDSAPDLGLRIIDFAQFSIDLSEDLVDQHNVDRIAAEIIEAFSTVGFVYLKNCGISDKETDKVRQCARQFFTLPNEVKKLYARQEDEEHGWVGLEGESLNPEGPGDLKEAYNVTPLFAKVWPDKEIPDFQQTMMNFYKRCFQLSQRVLKTLAIGLKLQDADLFTKAHTFEDGATALRSLYYPAIPKNREIKANQVRCGEHSDYGSITLLFQDDVGGLQKHRVILPEDEVKRHQVRQSLAFFVNPHYDTLVECLDGSQKYDPITAGEYLWLRIAATY